MITYNIVIWSLLGLAASLVISIVFLFWKGKYEEERKKEEKRGEWDDDEVFGF